MLTVEDIRKKADSPYTKGYQELERLYQTLPELFSKNAFAPIFKSSEKLALAEQSGDAVQQEPMRKNRGQNYIEMRMDDYNETLAKSQGKHHPEGGLRSTLENHFMDEGIRAQATLPKTKQPEYSGFPPQEAVHKPEHPQPNVGPKEVANVPPSQQMMPNYEMYMPMQPGMYPEGYEEEYDAYYDPQMDPHYAMAYGPPMHGQPDAYKQQYDHYMQGHPAYYYPPADPMMGQGFAAPVAQKAKATRKTHGAGAKETSDDNDQKVNSKEDMELANYIKKAGVIDDMEMDAGYPYYPPETLPEYPPQPQFPYNGEYMYNVHPGEGEEDMQGAMHMMQPYQYGYYGKGHDPRYGPIPMGYEDHYAGYGVHPQYAGYDPHGYMQQEYGMAYDPNYGYPYYGEPMEDQEFFDPRQQKQGKHKKREPINNPQAPGAPMKAQGQQKTQRVQPGGPMPDQKAQRNAIGQNMPQNKPQKKPGQPGQPQQNIIGGPNPHDVKQYQQPKPQGMIQGSVQQNPLQLKSSAVQPKPGFKEGEQAIGQQQANKSVHNKQGSNPNNRVQQPGPELGNIVPENKPKKTHTQGIQNGDANLKKHQSSTLGNVSSPGEQQNPRPSQPNQMPVQNKQPINMPQMQQMVYPGHLGHPGHPVYPGHQANQLRPIGSNSFGEIGQAPSPPQQKKKKPTNIMQPVQQEPEYVDDYYEENPNGQERGPNSSQKSGNRARQVFFVKK